MRDKTWTLRTFEDGETARVKRGLSHEEAMTAIGRAMRGLDPLADTATHRTAGARPRGSRRDDRQRVAA